MHYGASGIRLLVVLFLLYCLDDWVVTPDIIITTYNAGLFSFGKNIKPIIFIWKAQCMTKLMDYMILNFIVVISE